MEAHGDADADSHTFEERAHTAALSTLAASALPVRSPRFWTFFLAFGGLTGALLTWLGPFGTLVTALVAGVVGYVTGVGASLVLRWVARDQVSSTLHADGCVGATGTVLLPIAPGTRGRIRIALEGQMIDFDAEVEDSVALATSDSVVVYAVRDDGVALVTANSMKGTLS